MSASPRLTELIGIDSRQKHESSWPMNLLLLALGGVIIWVAFNFLKPNDPRLQFNPWSYVVATPVVLIGLSLLLRNITNRGVERSLQIGFLLSLLLHLLLSLYAKDVVVFTRLWPEIFENLAEERKVLERQSRPAPRYHNLSASRAEKKPDYLRHVPTKHQPTEVNDASEEALQLAMNHKTELVSPKPEISKSATPHLVPREKSQLPPPQSADQVAVLSRSESKLSKPNLSLPESMNAAIESAPPEPMRPAEASVDRSRGSGASLRNDLAANQAVKKPSAAKLDRRELNAAVPEADTRMAKPRASSSTKRQNAVDVPEAPLGSAEAPANAIAASDAATRDARTSRDSMMSLSPPTAGPKLTPTIPKENPMARRMDRAAELRVPSPSAGDMPSAFARESAGGRASSSAPRSMPIQGPDSIASPTEAEPDFSSAMSSLAQRNSQIQRSTSGLSALGLPQSQLASDNIGIPSNTDGQSSTVMPQRAGEGSATAEDTAGLAGAGRSIQRSKVGVDGRVGPIEVPAGEVAGGDDANAVARLNASEAGTGKGNVASPAFSANGISDVAGKSNAVDGIVSTRSSGIPEGLTRSRDSFTASEGEATAGPPGSSLTRQSTNRNVQPSAIDVPDASGLEQESSPGDLQAAGGLIADSRMRNESIALAGPSGVELDIKADLGRGGLADLSRDGVIVPRIGRMVDPQPMMEIDSQRFSRQEIGGPLAAGSNIPLPKPAFKQRLDRLKENQSTDDSMWGPQTEQAIEAGLEFLAKNQSESGAWRLQDFDTKVLIRSDTAATALSLLSFQGAGYTHQQYQYANTVGKALDFLVRNQQANGDLYKREDPASDQNAWLYSHAIASLALCEAYGMTQDPALREPAQKAINFMVESQDKQRGGWRYRPGNGTDTSVSGWFMMAFKSGQLAGLDVPKPTFDRIEWYLDQSQVSKSVRHLYRYNPFAADTPEQRHGREPTPVMTSAGLLMRLYFGWQRGQPEMTAGADYLLEHPPAPGTKDETLRDTYYWYYSTQVLFHMGGERWKKWNNTLYPMLIQTQVTDGPQAGSWDPYQPTADLWAKYGGRLYVTTLNLLSLEVNYRHLPLYDATAK